MTPERDEPEVALSGGNMTAVVRVGDTVRRAAGPWTPTIHAFMRHLRASGFTRIPEPHGLDGQRREIISLLPGAPAAYPLPDFAWSDATLASVAQALRAFHDASVGFTPPPDAHWRWPAHEPAEVVCHNDFAPYNLLFERGQLTGVIDLDLASPGPRVRDMGYAAYRFVALTHPRNPDAPYRGLADQRRRLAAFCAAYGDPGIPTSDVIDAAIKKLHELTAFITDAAAAGDEAQQAVLARGDVDIYQRDLAHLDRHRTRLGDIDPADPHRSRSM